MGKFVKVTYYAERINGEIRFFKKNTDMINNFTIAVLEISKYEYEWATR